MNYSLLYQFVNGRREEGGGLILIVNTSTSIHILIHSNSLVLLFVQETSAAQLKI